MIVFVVCAASVGGDDDDCSAAGCAEICLSSSTSTVTCTCPSDNSRVLAADQQLCRGSSLGPIIEPHSNTKLSYTPRRRRSSVNFEGKIFLPENNMYTKKK